MKGYDSASYTLGRILATENCRPGQYYHPGMYCSSSVPCIAIAKSRVVHVLALMGLGDSCLFSTQHTNCYLAFIDV